MKALTTAAVFLSLVGAALPRVGALEFILHTKNVEEDGFTKEQLYVHNDEHSDVLLSLPARWARTDGPAALTLIPADVRNSLVRVEKSSLTPGTEFRGTGLDTYRRRAQADVPQGATNVQLREEHDNPLPIFGWTDHEFVFTYDFFGQAYRRSVTFVNLNAREQITLTCVAPMESFDAVHEEGFDVLRSWQIALKQGQPTRP